MTTGTRIFSILIISLLVAVQGRCSEETKEINPLYLPPMELPEVETAPFLGIFMRDLPDGLAYRGVEKGRAVYVEHVMKDTAAWRAGLMSGDVIVSFDGMGFMGEPARSLKEFIRGRNKGDSIRLRIIRDGFPGEVEAVLDERKRIEAPLKENAEIKESQAGLGREGSRLYRVVEEGYDLGDFLKTLSIIRDRSFLLDSFRVSEENPFRLTEINYILHNPTDLIPVSRKVSNLLRPGDGTAGVDVPGTIRALSWELDSPIEESVEQSPELNDIEAVIGYMEARVRSATAMMDRALRGLQDEDLEFMKENAVRILRDDSGDARERLLKAATGISFTDFFKSLEEASRALSPQVIAALERMKAPGPDRSRSVETGLGRVIIGGTGDDRYSEDAFLIIDFGGNDLYENNSGSSTDKNPFCMVIDLAGEDLYISGEGAGQGTGVMGMGMVLDMEGNDVYVSDGPSQGAGIFGGGILLDLKGNDIYLSDLFAQGSALFGIGLLIDGSGDDFFRANAMAQGFASVKGLGGLADHGGDDRYVAMGRYPDPRDPKRTTISLSQGFSFGLRPYETPAGAPGGIGVLMDSGGDDLYQGDYFSQGAGYFYGLGVLHDMGGDDRYLASRYAQGAGIHTAAGALIDEHGDDSYTITTGVGQGTGHDFGIGVLADLDGNDDYRGGFLSQARATCGSLGFLYDGKGRNTFASQSPERDGDGKDTACGANGFGILMDRGEKGD